MTTNLDHTALQQHTLKSQPVMNVYPPAGGSNNNNNNNNNRVTNKYYKESERLKSFEPNRWPIDYISKEELARTGFYYKGPSDGVKCYFCGIQLCNWQRTDTVTGEHEKWAPSCPLIRRRQTNNVPIDAALLDRTLPPLSIDECGLGPVTSLNFTRVGSKLVANPNYLTEKERQQSFRDWPRAIKQTPEELAEAGFFYTERGDRVKCFKCGVEIKNWRTNDDPWERHAKESKNCEYVELVKGTSFISSAFNKISITSETKDPCTGPTHYHQSENGQHHIPDDEESLCKICYDNKLDTIFLPCAHVVACAKCALSVTKCPLCRQPFSSIKKIYFS